MKTGSGEPDPHRQEQARAYSRISRRLWALDTILAGSYALAWMFLGWGIGLRDWLVRGWPALSHPWLLVAALCLVFGGLLGAMRLPLDFVRGYILPHRFGQSTQAIGDWVIDQVKALAITLPLGMLMVELLYVALREAGHLWWVWVAGGLLIFNVLLAGIAPVVIMPLFNKFVPLGEEHEELQRRLLGLAHKAGTTVRGVYTFDMSRRTKAANAALTGLGSTRRIILGDTLLREFSSEEIEAVMAHELGHHVHRDMLVFIASGTALTIGGLYVASILMEALAAAFGYSGISDPAGLPALSVILGSYAVVTMPLGNWLSRWREALADRYAMEITGQIAPFASAFVRLADHNLSDVDPEPWVVWMFYSHPPLGERIAAAQAWERRPQFRN